MPRKTALHIKSSVLLIISILYITIVPSFANAAEEVQTYFIYTKNLSINYSEATGSIADPLDPYNLPPYATIHIYFPRDLNEQEKIDFQDNFYIYSISDNDRLKHLHEVAPVPVSGPNASFYWQNNHSLWYTAADLAPGKEYQIFLPEAWIFKYSWTGLFQTQALTSDLRIYNIIVPNINDWAATVTSENLISNLNSRDLPDFAPCYFNDTFASREYTNTEIRPRGYSSLTVDKKSFTIKFDDDHLFTGFKDSSGVYQGPRKKIVFVANRVFTHDTFINNRLSYEVLRTLQERILGAPLSADSYFGILTINGRFWGLYNISEHIDTGTGGWSTMRDRVERLHFDSDGLGMLYKFGITGTIPETEHKFRLPEEGTGTRTTWEGIIPYGTFVESAYDGFNQKTMDVGFEAKAKRQDESKMSLTPDLSTQQNDTEQITFQLTGDGAGEITTRPFETAYRLEFSEPVRNNKPVNIYYYTDFDWLQYEQTVSDNPSLKYDWLDMDSVLINIFYTRLAASGDHFIQNRYFFNPHTELEDFRGALTPPQKYYDIIWDGDFTFQYPEKRYEKDDSWGDIIHSPEARQRYINLFYEELQPGRLLSQDYYQKKINEFKAELGNGIQWEELRWQPQINMDPARLTYFFANHFLNDSFMNGYLLSLLPDNYIEPDYDIPTIIEPLANTTINSTSPVLHWNAGSASLYRLDIGTAPGASDIFQSGEQNDTYIQASGLSLNGEKVFIRLHYYQNNSWNFNDHIYTMAVPTGAELLKPLSDNTIRHSKIYFEWSAGAGVSSYQLVIGSEQGLSDIYTGPVGTETSATVENIPLISNGTIYVRVRSEINGTWVENEYPIITERNFPPTIFIHQNRTNFAGKSIEQEIGAHDYEDTKITITAKLENGDPIESIGAYIVFDEGVRHYKIKWDIPADFPAGTVNMFVTATDEDGLSASTIFSVTVCQSGRLYGLSPNQILPSSSMTFQWDAGSEGVTYKLEIGTSSTRSNIFTQNYTSNTSVSVHNLPQNGSTIYVKLTSKYYNWTVTETIPVKTLTAVKKPLLIGDINLDGKVTIGDLSILSGHYKQSGTYLQGDLNFDNTITLADLTILAGNYGKSEIVLPISFYDPDDANQTVLFTLNPDQSRVFHSVPNRFFTLADLQQPGFLKPNDSVVPNP